MEIGLISFSYENTPIEIREEINFSSRDYEKAYQILNNNPDLKESIIVSTCNRTEVYFIAEDEFNSVIDFVKDMLVKVFTLNSDDILDSYLQYKNDIEVVEHLLEVASACRSQVVGEQQILGQIKSEYERALKYEASGKFLNYFFKEAISTSKKIRTETGFCDKNLSLSSVAVSFIEKKVDKFKDKDILVVGIGEMSRLVIDILQKKGVNNIYATNRTHHKVVKVSDYYDNVIPVNYSGLPKKIFEVDIVISSTSAPHFVIHYDKLQKYYGEEKINEADKPLIMIDLGVPRDIEPLVKEKFEITVYNLDDLNRQKEKNQEYRLAKLKEVKKIIEKKLNSIKKWINWQQIVPVIKDIKSSNSKIIARELKTLYNKIELETEIKKEVEIFAEHLSKNLFNDIILNLKKLSREDRENIEEIAAKIFER